MRLCQDVILQPLHLMRSRKQPFTILDNASGVLKPGRFTLLLGPPSSGKSTMLKALAGRLHHSADLKVGVTPSLPSSLSMCACAGPDRCSWPRLIELPCQQHAQLKLSCTHCDCYGVHSVL